jgi:hypothetical protein
MMGILACTAELTALLRALDGLRLGDMSLGTRARLVSLLLERDEMYTPLVLHQRVEGEARITPALLDHVQHVAGRAGALIEAHDAAAGRGPRYDDHTEDL